MPQGLRPRPCWRAQLWLTGWQRSGCCVVLCWQNLLEIHPLEVTKKESCSQGGVSWEALNSKTIQERRRCQEELLSTGCCWLLCRAGAGAGEATRMPAAGACQASPLQPVSKPLPVATSLQRGKIFKGPVSVFTRQAKRVNLELRGNTLITGTSILKELKTQGRVQLSGKAHA